MEKVEIITNPKQKTWDLLDDPANPGHFRTGYVGCHGISDQGTAGRNAIITGDFHIDGMSRGRSAANFNGHFRGHEAVGYQIGMSSLTELLLLMQSGWFPIRDGYIRGRWTFVKQGQSVVLLPLMDE